MKCGSCKKNHETVAEVRACFGVPAKEAVEDVSGSKFNEPLTTGKNGKNGQYEFIQALLAERDMTPLGPYDEVKSQMSKMDASRYIGELIAMGIEKSPGSNSIAEFKVPAGRYAVTSATGNNDLDFWAVDRPEEGRWKGYVFVKRVIGGHPDQNVRGAEAIRAMKAIEEAGPDAAALLYSWEIGQCRWCFRHLTRRTPRFNGQGNDCAEMRGLPQILPPDDWRPEIQDEVS